MENFENDFLDYLVDDYYDVADSDEEEARRIDGVESQDSDFEDDDFDMRKSRSDTSAMEARNGKDIQGIPWERLPFGRDKYRDTRLKQYKNYESLSCPRQDLEKECLQVEMGKTFYDFQFNTRLVKATIVHFQIDEGCLLLVALANS